jgi:hypothetical protein
MLDASTEAQLVWLFDYINPYLQIGFAIVSLLCGGICLWSVRRRFSLGVLLLGASCVGSFVQTLLFVVSAVQDGQPVFSLSLDFRRSAYLCGRLLGPPQAILFAVTALVIARENRGG